MHSKAKRDADITDVIGKIPYRMAFAGGWIDQPFVSKHNPSPPGSTVVVALEPTCRFMDRCGMGTSTRKVALELWNGALPIDLLAILGYYQSRCAGAMYSGCGGGYIYAVSEREVPGSIRVKVRVAEKGG